MTKKVAVYRQLENAKAKIATKSTWTKDTEARDKYSKPVAPTSYRACRFCSVGALEATGTPTFGFARDFLDIAADELSSSYCIVELNDSRNTNHKFLMQVWDRAIELAYKASKKKRPV